MLCVENHLFDSKLTSKALNLEKIPVYLPGQGLLLKYVN